MKSTIQLQKAMFPDLLDTMQKRYTILYTVAILGPVGRRGVVDKTNFQERFIRNELNILAKQEFIASSTKGMYITEDGERMVEDLRDFIKELTGLNELELSIEKRTNIPKVIVIPGDSEQDAFGKQELGRSTIKYLEETIRSDETIAVTGGTTMAAVSDAMRPFKGIHCTFVPARGGVGEKVENQANTIAAHMAKMENGDYHLLHVPDPLSETLYQTILEEPSIKETLPYIKNAGMVLHGIGDALSMAARRKTSEEVIQKLKKEAAVSEAFGYYFNEQGDIVHKVRTVGIHLEDLEQMKVITVAGGTSKANAIASFIKQGKTDVLITDEAVAQHLVNKNI
ncbi:MAG TPA: sugar-binding domain-containing protein [Pseudogracilibacillus sp.]|nr:sugar-binding domain-containing protein [Pseudogracilibacillus sp.]